MTSQPQLDGRVAIVTGGSRGIGLALTRGLVERGARVVASGRTQRDLDAVSQHFGDAVATVRGDVADRALGDTLVRTATERFGGLDVLINNAGFGLFAPVAEMAVDDWDRLIATNLTGVFLCTRAAIPALRQRGGGWVINISSLAGKNSFAGGAAYCASKAGLNAFSEALMQELRHDNIRVSYVLPGSVATEFSGRATDAGGEWRLLPEDIAEVIVDLLAHPARSLPSRVEIRPSRPQKS